MNGRVEFLRQDKIFYHLNNAFGGDFPVRPPEGGSDGGADACECDGLPSITRTLCNTRAPTDGDGMACARTRFFLEGEEAPSRCITSIASSMVGALAASDGPGASGSNQCAVASHRRAWRSLGSSSTSPPA